MIINKITHGFVIQQFDTDKGRYVEQEFIAGDPVEYETTRVNGGGEFVDDSGNILGDVSSSMPHPEPYLSFHMVQPKKKG